VAAREEERRRLRRDLHDGIGPTLASLVQQLDVASRLVPRDPESAVSLLIDLKAQTRTTVGDIRRLVYALRPPALDELGLVSAIREHAAQHLEPTGLHVTMSAPASFRHSPRRSRSRRSVLEALTNAVRHANARSCSVRLTCGPDLVIEILDDGHGLPEVVRAGVGLASMHDRAAELGGECVVERAPDAGTRVWARLPLPGPAPEKD
jgi:signal transduction histidine kinase